MRTRPAIAAAPLALALALACAACPGKGGAPGPASDHPGTGTGTGAASAAPPPGASDAAPAAIVLPPAPPPPAIPRGLPPPGSVDAGAAAPRAEGIALGERLFFDPRLSASGATSCATCHDPDHGWADLAPRAKVDGGQPNLRRTPALVNLAWARSFGWDGRATALPDMIAAHWKGQLGAAPADVAARLAAEPTYAAHLARQAPPAADPAAAAAAMTSALAQFVATRYQGDAPWDRYERGDQAAVSAAAVAGYALFTGKAQCSVCHVPPLYTDGRFHALGLIQAPDEGRGRVDPAARGAFATPTVRGAALHPPYFHDGSAPTLAAAIDWHLAGGTGQGADRSIVDPALVAVTLTPDERAALGAFVLALSPDPAPPPYHRPELPR